MSVLRKNPVEVMAFDPHCHGRFEYEVDWGSQRWRVKMSPPGTQFPGPGIVWVMDEYCLSRIPFFYPRALRVAVLKEGPLCTRQMDEKRLVKRYNLILTHRADLVAKGHPFVRVDFSTNHLGQEWRGLVPSKTRLLSFMGRVTHPLHGGYALRSEVAAYLKEASLADCFGRGLRSVDSKVEALLPYCFSVAMENSREDFYYTEKLIECFLCETVPVYWGCPGIGQIFDPRGYIAFSSLDELTSIIRSLSIERYRKMLPYVRANKARALEMDVADYKGYLRRLICATINNRTFMPRKIARWRVSKPLAGLRFLMETFISKS